MAEDGYASKSGCLNGVEAISRASLDATVDESALEQ
jgi:uncharacterized protein YegP (UPF0339 family)